MQRNSSFFWQSDDFVSEDEDFEFGTVGLDVDDPAADTQADEGSPSSDGKRAASPTPTDRSPLLVKISDNYGFFEMPTTQLLQPLKPASQQSSQQSKSVKGVRFHSPTPEYPISELSIRFQVVIWYVGEVNVCLGSVPMQFRVTLFWNDVSGNEDGQHQRKRSNSHSSVWKMEGRQKATLHENLCTNDQVLDIPPLSILNAVSFDIIGTPEVAMIRKDTRLMRWTCMYSAVLLQQDMRVDNFPHDSHVLVLRLGILAHRNAGQEWDKKLWKLQLATEKDSQGSTRIPHGLVVDHAHIPGFSFNKDALQFEFVPHKGRVDKDQCLEVRLPVVRDSGHYDMNIFPLMVMLNIVAISCLPRAFAPNTGSTELLLNIAFVEIGFRFFIDSRLPSVGYQIKLQRILNNCFWLLMCLALESNLVYFLVDYRDWSEEDTDWFHLVVGVIALLDTIYMVIWYYHDLE